MAVAVTVVVVNWNGARYLRDCLGSLAAQTLSDFRVILVDNGSDDDSVSLVKSEFPNVCVLSNERNLGFARANNQAISATDSEFVALLNNDAQAEPDWLERLLAVMTSDPSVGACASRMVFAQSPGTINSTGISLDKAGIAWDRWGGRPDTEGDEEVSEVFGACAGAAMYRRALFEDIGLFDEDFFAYLEDVDLAWRARLRRWRCLYVPAAKVRHYHSGTGKEGSSFKNYLLGRNKVWAIVKNYEAHALLKYLPAIVIYDLGSVQYSLLVRGDLSPLRGRLAALAAFPRLWRKRCAIQARRTALPGEVEAFMEPLMLPGNILRRYRHLRRLSQPETIGKQNVG
ncbi:MAG: glycosyltransferase family 2 protein [Chloroflexota bacterium]